MKNRNMVLVIVLMVMAVSSACAQQYNDEKDFKVEKIDGGKGVEITEYVGEKFEVRIPPRIQGLPVTSIGQAAFKEKGITSITIPNSVTSIGNQAFRECTSLTSVTIPNSVTNIGGYAFCGCSSLAGIIIPNSVTSIGNSAFLNCPNLKSVIIPNSVTSIGELAFSGCTSLTRVTIPNSVTSIGILAFYSCTSLTSITFQGTIASNKLGGMFDPFDGDLREKYLAGGIGTYTTTTPVPNDYWDNRNTIEWEPRWTKK